MMNSDASVRLLACREREKLLGTSQNSRIREHAIGYGISVKGEISFAIAISRRREQGQDGVRGDEKEWAERVARHLKAELKRADVTYEELALRLKDHGFDETKASITNKLSRATLSAHFFLASLPL